MKKLDLFKKELDRIEILIKDRDEVCDEDSDTDEEI